MTTSKLTDIMLAALNFFCEKQPQQSDGSIFFYVWAVPGTLSREAKAWRAPKCIVGVRRLLVSSIYEQVNRWLYYNRLFMPRHRQTHNDTRSIYNGILMARYPHATDRHGIPPPTTRRSAKRHVALLEIGPLDTIGTVWSSFLQVRVDNDAPDVTIVTEIFINSRCTIDSTGYLVCRDIQTPGCTFPRGCPWDTYKLISLQARIDMMNLPLLQLRALFV